MEHPKENPAGAGGAQGGSKEDSSEYRRNPDEKKEVSLVEAALDYAAKGILIFPCKNCPEDMDDPIPIKGCTFVRHKAPLTKHGFKDASIDPDAIRRWWKKWPNAFIGMPTGCSFSKGGGVDVLDLDNKTNKAGVHKNGFTHVPDWETRTPVISRTGSGGAHLFFKSDGSIRNTIDEIAMGVDTRGLGGYVIIPPSEGYTWVNGSDFANLPPWPDDLRPRERSPDAKPGANPEAPLAVVAGCVDVIPNPDLNWEEWNTLGMAIWRATGGANEGADIFDAFSKKSTKYDARETQRRWNGYFRSPPTKVGFGTLSYHADEAELEAKVCGRWTWPDEITEPVTLNNTIEEVVPEAKVEEPSPKAETKEQPTKVEGPPPKAAPEQPKIEDPPKADPDSLFLTSKQFVGGFVPPDYLIDGLLLRRYLYALTAPTGHGKTSILMRLFAHIAYGLPIGKREVERGKVLFLAGENPDDIRMRWIKLAEEMKIDPHCENILWREGSLKLSAQALRVRIENELHDHGPFAAVGVDTSVSFFEGDNENDNTQMVAHARMLRSLCDLRGGPTTIVTTHPIKNYDLDNLLPRGGGAFLAEVDGNFVCPKNPATNIATLSWQGKLRGPDFAPIPFKIEAGTTEKLKDSKGRLIFTVTAKPITDAEQETFEAVGERNLETLLFTMEQNRGASLAKLAELCGWYYRTSTPDEPRPNKTLVYRYLKTMEDKGWVKKTGDQWTLTKAGEKEAKRERPM